MRKRSRFLIKLAVVVLAFVAAAMQYPLVQARAASPTPTGVVRINEIMWAGSYTGTTYNASDQWIELYNTTNQPVDISNWALTTISTNPQTLTIPASTTIAPYGYFLISHNTTGSASILNTTPDLVSPNISQLLSSINLCQPIELIDNFSNIDDAMGCSPAGNYFAGSNNNLLDSAASMARITPYSDGTLANSWQTSSNNKNLTSAAFGQDFATPKFYNGTDITAPIDGDIVVSGLGNNKISASWNGFYDPETGITNYQLGLGNQPISPNLQPFTDVGLANNYIFTVSNPVIASQYYIFIQAENGANLFSAPVVSQVLPPILSQNLITINQNPPGTSDTVSGAVGAASDPQADLMVYSSNPLITPAAQPIASEIVNNDGSFNPINIGDNLYTAVWLELTDIAGTSNIDSLANDTIAPNSPTISSIHSICQETNCQVTISWQDNGPDSSGFFVTYTVNGITTITPELTGASTTLELPDNQTFSFTVKATDTAGNLSAASSPLTVALIPNAIISTTASGNQVAFTQKPAIVLAAQVSNATSLSNTSPASEAPTSPAPASSGSNNSSSTSAPSTPPANSNSFSAWDWVQIIIAVILLIFAGIFFYLARSVARANTVVPANGKITTKNKKRPANLKRGGQTKRSPKSSKSPPS